jgi:four helix bundle protein
MLESHKDLKVWQESMILVEDVYKITATFPKEELFGLTSQLKRSSVSVPSNIAEGAGRRGKTEFIRFLYIAMGSLSELDTQLELAERLSFYKRDEEIFKRVYYIKSMLAKLIKSLDR